MSRGSSGHFAKGGAGYFAHNDRSTETKNSIFSDEENEVSCTATEAFQIYRDELSKRATAYTARTNQKLQKNIVTHRSLIVNLEEHHTLRDLESVRRYLEKSLDTKVLQIAIHKDEGYIDIDTKKKHINTHAHIEMMGIDSLGISIAQHQNKKSSKQKVEQTRTDRLDSKFYSKFQTFLAETLKMKRGVEGSKAKRLDTYEYKREAEIRSDLVRATITQVKEQFRAERKELVATGAATKEQHAQLKAKYKELEAAARAKELSEKELREQLQELANREPKTVEVERVVRVRDTGEEDRLRRKLKELEQERAEQEKREQNFKRAFDDLERRYADSQKQLISQRETIETQNKRIDTQVSLLSSYRQDIAQIKHKNKELTGEISNIKQVNAELKSQTLSLNAERSDKERALELQLKAKSEENEELKGIVSRLADILSTTKSQIVEKVQSLFSSLNAERSDSTVSMSEKVNDEFDRFMDENKSELQKLKKSQIEEEK